MEAGGARGRPSRAILPGTRGGSRFPYSGLFTEARVFQVKIAYINFLNHCYVDTEVEMKEIYTSNHMWKLFENFLVDICRVRLPGAQEAVTEGECGCECPQGFGSDATWVPHQFYCSVILSVMSELTCFCFPLIFLKNHRSLFRGEILTRRPLPFV